MSSNANTPAGSSTDGASNVAESGGTSAGSTSNQNQTAGADAAGGNATKIWKVRQGLRDVDGDQFTPEKVSIGFYHHGLHSDLDKNKEGVGHWMCPDGRANWIRVRKELRKQLGSSNNGRDWYPDIVPSADVERQLEGYFSLSDSSRMPLLDDGCYVLHFLVGYVDETGVVIKDPWREENENSVMRDILFLLENQIPWSVLREMHGYIRDTDKPDFRREMARCIGRPILTDSDRALALPLALEKELADRVRGLLEKRLYTISGGGRRLPVPSSPAPTHLLDLVHHYFKPTAERPPDGEGHRVNIVGCCMARWRRAMDVGAGGAVAAADEAAVRAGGAAGASGAVAAADEAAVGVDGAAAASGAVAADVAAVGATNGATAASGAVAAADVAAATSGVVAAADEAAVGAAAASGAVAADVATVGADSAVAASGAVGADGAVAASGAVAADVAAVGADGTAEAAVGAGGATAASGVVAAAASGVIAAADEAAVGAVAASGSVGADGAAAASPGEEHRVYIGCCDTSVERKGRRMGMARWRRATEYRRYAFVQLKRRDFKKGVVESVLDVRLEGRTLWIPTLRIDELTYTLLRNLIALEDRMRMRQRPVTAYCLFMSQLACKVEDVELLQRLGILQNFLPTDEDVVRGFGDLCKEVVFEVDDLEMNYLNGTWHKLHKRCRAANTFFGLFRERHCSNSVLAAASTAAVLLFVFQAVQVAFAVASYTKKSHS